MKRKLILTAMVFSLCISSSYSASKGTSGAQFLKVIAAPRVAALAGTYAAVNDDVNSIVCNPAGLAGLQKKEVVLVQNNWIQDIANQYFAYGMPIGKAGTLGVSVIMLSVKDINKVNNSAVAQGTYGTADTAVSLAYAAKLGEKLSVGLNAKSISSKIDDVSASAMAADIGGQYKASEKLNIGLVAENVGTELKFIAEGDPLPMLIKLGGAYTVAGTFLLALDVNSPNDGDVYVGVGSEYCIAAGEKLVFPVRVGYRTGMETGGLSGLGTGAGILYNNLFGVDFAWTPVGDLGDSVKFGLRFIF